MNVERNLFVGTIAAIITVVLLVVAYLGEDARMTHETESQRGILVARGARLYATYCAGCHGKRGEGLPGIYPPLNVQDLWSGKEDIAFYGTLHDFISLNISAGHPSQRMPSWADDYGGALRNDQIEDLTQFVLNWMGPQPEGVRGDAAGLVPFTIEDIEPVTEPGQGPTRGGQFFALACARCHGINATGTDLGPSLLNAQVMDKDDNTLHDTIINGRPGTSMPAWGKLVNSQDSEYIVAYLRALAGGEIAPVVLPEGTEPLLDLTKITPAEIVPDPTRGAGIYAQTCFICHGETGQGTANGPALNDPAQLEKNSDAWYRDTIAYGRPAKGMPTWGTVLSPAQINDLVALLAVWRAGETVSPDISLATYLINALFAVREFDRIDAEYFLSAALPEADSSQAEEIRATIGLVQENRLFEADGRLTTLLPPEAMGKAAFESNCALCHGSDGSGGMGPNLRANTYIQSNSDAELAAFLLAGRKGTAMDSFEGILTEEALYNVVALLRAWQE